MKETVMLLSGYGITARVWAEQPEVARKHLRDLYARGTQCAFCYYEGDTRMHHQALRRLALAHADDARRAAEWEQEAKWQRMAGIL